MLYLPSNIKKKIAYIVIFTMMLSIFPLLPLVANAGDNEQTTSDVVYAVYGEEFKNIVKPGGTVDNIEKSPFKFKFAKNNKDTIADNVYFKLMYVENVADKVYLGTDEINDFKTRWYNEQEITIYGTSGQRAAFIAGFDKETVTEAIYGNEDGVSKFTFVFKEDSKEEDKSSSGSSGSRSKGSSSRSSETVNPSKGKTIKYEKASVYIPEGAFDENINVTIAKYRAIGNLPFDKDKVLVSDVYDIYKNKSGDFKKAVTITLPFFKDKVDRAKQDLGVYYLNEDKKTWELLDSIQVDFSEGTVSGKVKHFSKFAVFATKKGTVNIVLGDINGHWAEKDIRELLGVGAVGGYPDGTFKPDNNITRAEFTSILARAFELEEKGGKDFADTKYHWAQEPIKIANGHGIVNGLSDTIFGPDELLTREQMTAMLVNALKLPKVQPNKIFTDQNDISPWAVEVMNTAIANNLIGGYEDNTIRPQNNATRAEAVAVIVRALEKR